MKLALAIASTFAAIAVAAGQGGYSSGGSSNFGYTQGGGNNIGGAPGQSYGAPGAGGFGGSSGGAGGPPSQSYGAPGGFSGANSFGQGASGAGQSGYSDANQGPQTFRHISVHTAPADPDDEVAKVVRVPGGKNKHVNIIFVKTPSSGSDQKTEVVLPEPDEHKNLVYVLVQKSDAASNLKIKRPQATKPSKPEVYFIRYKNGGDQQQGSQGGAGSSAGAIAIDGFGRGASGGAGPGGFSGNPSQSYGAPSSGGYGAP